MFRHATLLAIALAAALAGCSAPGQDPGSEGGPAAAAPAALTYGDCDELLGAFPVQEDAIALPEGFAPAPFLGEGTGAIFVVGWQCATATTDTDASEAAPFAEAFAGFSVTPPDELALDGAFAHAILLGLTTSSPLGLSTYDAWRVPALDDTLAFGWTPTPTAVPLGGAGVGTLEGPVGPLDVDMRVNVGGPEAGEAAGVVRFFVAEGQELVAAYDVAWTAAGGLQGQALSAAALPGAPPATTGLGFYYTSDEAARYTMTPFPLPAAGSA